MSPAERHDLLRYVRLLAESVLRRATAPSPPAHLRSFPHSGVFVTFHRGPHLRGCMGRLRAGGAFDEVLRDIVDASLHDPRFVGDPIELDELPLLDIEVSVLGPLREMHDIGELVPGRDGIVVTRAARSGCFLPQVASERGWSAETFLSECCRMKAGLRPDAWREAGTKVELFAAEVIAEADFRDSGGPAQDSTAPS